MGASTSVPLERRVPVWIDLVPRLLAHLNIPHVALASHSAGMIYLLNTLYHCREILHPERPYVAFLAPWVNPTHSRITSMQMAQFLPTRVFSIWNQIPKFLLLTATPVLESSGTIVNKVSSVSGTAPSGSGSAQVERNRDRLESEHGMSKEVQKELEPLTWRFMFEESTQGANDEALQCLCKGPAGSWGVCEDYERYVREVVERERNRGHAGGRLVVRGFFAESDTMIGEKGRRYVEGCWRGHGSSYTDSDSGGFDDAVDFETAVVPGTDHNTVSQETGLLERIFLEAGGRRSVGDH
ncbi:uncharacterized protein KD926_009517 [Aspergillus affinis]|uniref:uncharacterized protein n=1 Tax=Aspergillus affinis TaxID=1070780 RepID=UPI0022FEA111|nr:uncharacterized protein KD926_009517 [Aspergillus affinis]KAI9039374.1 hypothetical protein KD926_009517 [Aspergillus affinis]